MKITLHKHLGSSDKGLSSYIQIIDLPAKLILIRTNVSRYESKW